MVSLDRSHDLTTRAIAGGYGDVYSSLDSNAAKVQTFGKLSRDMNSQLARTLGQTLAAKVGVSNAYMGSVASTEPAFSQQEAQAMIGFTDIGEKAGQHRYDAKMDSAMIDRGIRQEPILAEQQSHQGWATTLASAAPIAGQVAGGIPNPFGNALPQDVPLEAAVGTPPLPPGLMESDTFNPFLNQMPWRR